MCKVFRIGVPDDWDRFRGNHFSQRPETVSLLWRSQPDYLDRKVLKSLRAFRFPWASRPFQFPPAFSTAVMGSAVVAPSFLWAVRSAEGLIASSVFLVRLVRLLRAPWAEK